MLLVCLWMDPPSPVLITMFSRSPLWLEAQVWQVWTVFVLNLSGLAGIETGPGVEDERTVGRPAANTAQVQPACALNQTKQEVFRGNKVAGGRIQDLSQ